MDKTQKCDCGACELKNQRMLSKSSGLEYIHCPICGDYYDDFMHKFIHVNKIKYMAHILGKCILDRCICPACKFNTSREEHTDEKCDGCYDYHEFKRINFEEVLSSQSPKEFYK